MEVSNAAYAKYINYNQLYAATAFPSLKRSAACWHYRAAPLSICCRQVAVQRLCRLRSLHGASAVRMDEEVVSIMLGLLHAQPGAGGALTTGGTSR